MRLDSKTSRMVSLGALAFVLAACTKDNPNYCADAGFLHNCAAADAAAHDRHEAVDAADASEDAPDAAKDAAPETTPAVCVTDDDCVGKDAGVFACDTTDGGAKCVECTRSSQCGGARPVCDKEKCVACTGAPENATLECKVDATKTVCNPSAQSCVECLDNSKCGGTRPICDKTQKACRACAADSECAGPGVCVDWDGHCAAASEVVTVQGGASCVAAGLLFCSGTSAVAALTSDHPILVIKGPDPVGTIEPPTGAPAKVLIVGQGGAVVAAGAGDAAGVHLSGAKQFWVRDLKVSGGTVGVLADGGADLHLTRSVVTMNGKGGIKTVASSFDITNTIAAANGVGTDDGGVAWGGVRLGDVPTGGASRFVNNTVVDNMLIGVSCKTPYDVSTDLIHGNVGANTANCTGAICCGAGDPDPMLDTAYHLKTGSPCIDKITPTTMSLTVDIQGQARPVGGALDCGADEFVP